MDVTGVEVYAGNAGPFLHGCIHYETADKNTTGLVVGVTVAVFVLIILVIVLVAVCCILSYRRYVDTWAAMLSDVVRHARCNSIQLVSEMEENGMCLSAYSVQTIGQWNIRGCVGLVVYGCLGKVTLGVRGSP